MRSSKAEEQLPLAAFQEMLSGNTNDMPSNRTSIKIANGTPPIQGVTGSDWWLDTVHNRINIFYTVEEGSGILGKGAEIAFGKGSILYRDEHETNFMVSIQLTEDVTKSHKRIIEDLALLPQVTAQIGHRFLADQEKELGTIAKISAATILTDNISAEVSDTLVD